MGVGDIERADLPQLARLFEALSGLPTPLARLETAFAGMAAHPDYHLVGVRDGSFLAGAALGIVCLDCVGGCRPFLVVENLIVAETHRRRGVGRRLLGELERRGRERDCFYVMLVSGRDRGPAHAFYAAMGYGAGAGFKKRL